MQESGSPTATVTLCVLLWARPGARSVEEFMADGRRQSLADERERVIARTEVIDVQLVQHDPGP
jgi:hypothetical protein